MGWIFLSKTESKRELVSKSQLLTFDSSINSYFGHNNEVRQIRAVQF